MIPIPLDVLLQVQHGTATLESIAAVAIATCVFLFLALLAACAQQDLNGRKISSWARDGVLLICGIFAFLIWWPVVVNCALPAHFVAG